jgi:hypothetical protein
MDVIRGDKNPFELLFALGWARNPHAPASALPASFFPVFARLFFLSSHSSPCSFAIIELTLTIKHESFEIYCRAILNYIFAIAQAPNK